MLKDETKSADHTLCLAPMMGITNRHFRYLIRLISKKCWLYTEMLPAAAIAISKKTSMLKFDEAEKPLAVQLAGNDVKIVTKAAKIAADMGYDEINLNIGCPSQRTNKGGFGLCLFNSPELVASLVDNIKKSVKIPVSIKTRIGVGYEYRPDLLYKFINQTSKAGCTTFIIHARPGVLENMSTKKNLNVPKLNYKAVYDLKKYFNNLNIIINGAIKDSTQAKKLLSKTNGVMIGRALAKDAFKIADIESKIFSPQGFNYGQLKSEVITKYLDYAAKTMEDEKTTPSSALRPMLSLFFNHAKAKLVRKHINLAALEKTPISYLKKTTLTT